MNIGNELAEVSYEKSQTLLAALPWILDSLYENFSRTIQRKNNKK